VSEGPTPPRGAGAAGPAGPADPNLHTIARGGALNLAGVVASTAFGFLVVVIVTRGVGATTAGLFFESVALFHNVAAVAQWGAEVGVVRAVPRYRVLGRAHDLHHVLWSALVPTAIAGAILGLGLTALAEPLGDLLTNGEAGEDLAPMIRVLAPFVPVFAVYTIALGATRGFGTMVPTTVVDKLGRAVGQATLAFVAVVGGMSAVAVAVAWATPYALGLVLAAAWLLTLVRRSQANALGPEVSARRSVFGEFWRFTAPRGMAGLFSVAILWLDTLLIGSLRSTAQAGIYAASTRLLTFGQFIGVAISQVVAPVLSGLLAAEDRGGARRIYATSTSWLMALAWPLYLTMIVYGEALLSVFGERYRTADAALAILGGAMLVATLTGPVDMVLLMAGKSSWNLVNTIVAVVVNVVLNLVLIPPYGVTGAAAAWGASILVNNLLPLAQVWRSVGLHPFGRGAATAGGSAVVSFALVAGVVRLALGPDFGSLIVAMAVAGPLHLLLLWRLRHRLELAAFRQIFRRSRGIAVEEP
jgi:O-antigen/teichoic acid export membrane protein